MGDVYQVKDMSLPAIENAEHIDPATTGDNIAAKKVAPYVWNGSTWVRAPSSGSILPSTLVNNQQTVTGTATALPSGALTVGVIFEALSTNTVSIFVGGSGVTTSTGIELQPGGALSAAVSNTNLLYVICASGSPVITWLGS